jgi:hypothetical protein
MRIILLSLAFLCSLAAADLRYVIVHDQDKNEYAGWWDDDTSILHMKGDKRVWYPDRSKVARVDVAKAPSDEAMPSKRTCKPASITHADVWSKNGDFVGRGWLVTAGEWYVLVPDDEKAIHTAARKGSAALRVEAVGTQSPPAEIIGTGKGLAIRAWN